MFKFIAYFIITLFARLYVRIDILLTSGKLHDRTIPIRGEVLTHKTSLTPPHCIEIPVASQEGERSCICLLGVMILELFRQCSIFCFSFYFTIFMCAKKN